MVPRSAKTCVTLVLAEAGGGPLVEGVGLVEGQCPRVDALVEDLLDQHPELRAPVADVVLGDDGVAEGAEHAVEAVSDDGGPEVPHVHLLGDVGGRVVDDDALRVGDGVDAAVRVLEERGGRGRQHVGAHAEVDEARTRDLQRLAQVLDVETLHDVRRDLAGRAPLLLGQTECDIGLEVSELGLGGGTHLGVDAGEVTQPGVQERGEGLHEGHSRIDGVATPT